MSEEHGRGVDALVEAGVDVLLIETMNSAREARIASLCASRSGVPFITSFALRPEDGRLYSGEDIGAAVRAVAPLRPVAILVNHCHQDLVEPAFAEIARALAGWDVGFGARPHLEKPTESNGYSAPGGCSVEDFVEITHRWLRAGARFIGGCCGTTPAYIAALARLRATMSNG
jgi:S-methylmethionine-dependent homocysteine/selenocysteine methylase